MNFDNSEVYDYLAKIILNCFLIRLYIFILEGIKKTLLLLIGESNYTSNLIYT